MFSVMPLYCILFLHQTTTGQYDVFSRRKLYCILFLHQTTTTMPAKNMNHGCIASSFYIKPQPYMGSYIEAYVVLHPLSTSNHNDAPLLILQMLLYCILFLHQTTTPSKAARRHLLLYCILFLHQTTTGRRCRPRPGRLYCILFLHQTTTDR